MKRPLLVATLVATLIAVLAPCAWADLFVISQNTNSVLRYNELTGQFIGEFVPSGSGGLQVPRGLLFGRDGHLYVTSSDSDSIMRYDGITGAPLPAPGQPGATFVPARSGGLKNPAQIILGKDGNLYVDSQDNNAVLRYDGATGAFLGVFVLPGSGGLNNPRGLLFGPDGNLYVKQRGGPNVVLRYHGTTGAPLPAPGQTGAVFVSLEGLRDGPPLLFGPDGNLYIGDFPTSRILRFNGVTGEYIDTFVSAGSGGLNGPGPLMLFGADKNLYICSENNNSVLRYDGTTGAFIDAFVSSGSGGLNLPHGQVFNKTDPTTLAYVAQSGTFTKTGNLTTPRSGHTATLLPNGKVLIAGGYAIISSHERFLASAELYDPAARTFTAIGEMTTARRGHTATLLPNGKVLIAGGRGDRPTASAELYDPSTGTFTAAGEMTVARNFHTATLLADGKVLMAGGAAPTFDNPYHAVPSAELFDPPSGIFSAIRNMAAAWSGQTATLLADGTVLIAVPQPPPGYLFGGYESDPPGGFHPRGEVYDPSAGTFAVQGNMTQGYMVWHTASLLMNGKVLISGGGNTDFGDSLASAELYDPSTGTFAFTGRMRTCRFLHTATLLPDGLVLMAGGDARYCTRPGPMATWASAEIYDPSTGTFTATSDLTAGRQNHTATLLNDGTVLMAGGFDQNAGFVVSAELYNPPSLAPAPVLFSLSGDGRGQGAIWHAATGQVASPGMPAVSGEILSMYTTGLGHGSVIPPQVAVGGRLGKILYFGDAPGYPGYSQVNFQVTNDIAPGAVPVRLTYLGRSSNEVTIGVK